MDKFKAIYSSFNVEEDPSPEVPLRLRLRRRKWPRPCCPPSDQDRSGGVRCTANASYQQQQQQKQKMPGLLGRPRSCLMYPRPPATSAASVVGIETKDDKNSSSFRYDEVIHDIIRYFKKEDVLYSIPSLKRYIYLLDLMRFMKEDEALKAMILFEGAKDNSEVSRECLKNWMVNVFRERKQLKLTLNDTKTVVHSLHKMADVNGVEMVVEEIDILTMTFLRSFDNQKVMLPNNELSTFSIVNYFRSPDIEDSIDFSIHLSTLLEKIATLKQRLISYMEKRPEH